MNNKEKQLISILSTIVLGIFIWFGYSLHWSLTIPDKDSFVVLDKVEKQAIKSTGKYSSEVVYRTFVEVRYENGDQTTFHIDNPIDAKKYEIGTKYFVSKYHTDMPVSVFLGYFLFGTFMFILISIAFSMYCSYLFSDD